MRRDDWGRKGMVYPWRALAALAAALALSSACGTHGRPTIAFIPRTTGSTLWEAEHTGAARSAFHLGYSIYWNAPTHEDDVEGQIALLQRIRSGGFQGLVLAPDHALAVLTSIRRLVASGTPVVIVSSPLALPPGKNLSYIVNDDEETGRIAASRVNSILHGRGEVAILGVDPDISSIMLKMRSLERELQAKAPGVRIAARGPGAFNAAEAQQATLAVLASHPSVNVMISLTAVSSRAAFFTVKNRGQLGAIKLISFEQDTDMIAAVRKGEVDSVIAEDTYAMGSRAVEEIAAERQGRRVPGNSVLPPILITRENADSPDLIRLTTMDWFLVK